MINFNENTISAFVNEPNKFTIELTDEVWTELGWTTKANCVRTLKQELIEGADFRVIKFDETSTMRVSADAYTLSYNGLKLLAVSAPGEKARQYRRHLIETENRYYEFVRQAKETVAKALPPMWRENRLLLSDVEPGYQRWCRDQGLSPTHLTNCIYRQVCNGDDAAALRLKVFVEGSPHVAANHIEQPELVEEVALIKQRLTKYTRKFATMYLALAEAVADLEKQRAN